MSAQCPSSMTTTSGALRPTPDEEVRDRGVQTVALRVGIGGYRRPQLTDPLRQIWQ